MPLTTHVAALGSTNSERVTATAREGFVRTCACTEPDGTDIGAVHVERGRNLMLNHTLPWYSLEGTLAARMTR